MRTETNRYGEPLQQVTIEDVLKDLSKMPTDIVYAICAVLIVEHSSYTWNTDRNRIIRGLSEKESE